MKVYIGPYKNWWGPYQLAEKLCFWVKDETDEYGTPRKPDWVHNFGEWLAHGSVAPTPTRDNPDNIKWDDERPETWLYKFLKWVDSKKSRTIKVRIDRYDTWSMDNTLALIILPMLKQLRDTKHGSPLIDDEDVPPHMRYSSLGPDEPEWRPDNWVHYKWEWVLNELVWTFEQLASDDDRGMQLFTLDNKKYYEYNDRVNNGLRLFGKYYRNLWD